MDHKAWSWRKRSSEKTTVVREKADTSFRGNGGKGVPTEKIASETCDCNAKDELVKKHAEISEKAIEGRQKAEAEAVYLKQELDKALQQGLAAEEKFAQLDSELKKCIEELSYVQEEQKTRVQDAVKETRRELEATQQSLKEKLADTSRRLESLAAENKHLSKSVLVKERLIEDLIKCKSQLDAEFSALMSRVDSTEKENAFLRYEFRMLEKELEIRNEEREFTQRAAEASQKQHVESLKKIGKLEAECQRLRLLLRKRMPGPATLAKIRSEVEIVARDQTEIRKKKLNSISRGLVVRDPSLEKSPEIPTNGINYLLERLCEVEGENKNLKEIISKRTNELDFSRTICAQTRSKLAQLELQLGKLSRNHKSMELPRCSAASNELSLTSGFGFGSGDDVRSSGSWASALASELEHFNNEKSRTLPVRTSIGMSDIRLMDDFVEMEKLAIVSVDTPFATSLTSADASNGPLCNLKETSTCLYGKELVPVTCGDSSLSDMNQEIKSKDGLNPNSHDWLQDVLKAILDQKLVSGRSFEELLEDITIAVAHQGHPSTTKTDAVATSRYSRESDPLQISGYITWKSPNASSVVNSFNEASVVHMSAEEMSSQDLLPNLSKSIGRIMELVGGIYQTSLMENNTENRSPERGRSSYTSKDLVTIAEHFVCVFQWKSYDLSAVLQQFIKACNDFLKGEINLENFSEEMASTLDWVMKNCITCHDVSNVKDKIKKHLHWDESHSANSNRAELTYPSSQSEVKQSSSLPYITSSREQDNVCSKVKIQHDCPEVKTDLMDEFRNLEANEKDLEARLVLTADKNDALIIQPQEPDQVIERLQRELEKMKESNATLEEQIENQKSMNEDLDTQLTVAKVKLKEVLQKFSSLEVEFEDKSSCCEELEAMCLELHLQLESIARKDILQNNIIQEDNKLQPDLEVTAASVKLQECQETIFNLGKQLKALASPREAALFDKVFSTASTATCKKLNQRPSLLDQMKSEDDAEVPKSPKFKEITSTVDTKEPVILHNGSCDSLLAGQLSKVSSSLKNQQSKAGIGAMAVVPSKRQGSSGGFLRKLFLRRKRSKKFTKSFASQYI